MDSLMVAGSPLACELSACRSIIAVDARVQANGDADHPIHGQSCSVCGHPVGLNNDGKEFVPCECAFRICRPCYEYIRSPPIDGDSAEEVMAHLEEVHGLEVVTTSSASPPPALLPDGQLQLGGGEESRSASSHASYGYGSIVWSAARRRDKHCGADLMAEPPTQEIIPLMVDDTRRPLSRKVPIPASLINPYRFVVIARFFIMILFFRFRIINPNDKAIYLWLASIICEIWLLTHSFANAEQRVNRKSSHEQFMNGRGRAERLSKLDMHRRFGVSWILDQVPKWSPVTRETFLHRLTARYEMDGEESQLPRVDVFVSTADPEKEPPLVTANVILSVLGLDYPVTKLSCYLSDDGASMLTFEALTETANFARSWVPFCHKFDIEPRAPEIYFTQALPCPSTPSDALQSVDFLRGRIHPDFVKERRHMKREYDEFKVRINALVAKSLHAPPDGWSMPDGSPWPGNYRNDHVGMIQVFLQPGGEVSDVDGNALPLLVYTSREKRPGYEHNKKAGAMNALMRASALISNAPFVLNLDCDHWVNNSQALREAACFLIDPQSSGQVAYVQFPQRFDGVDRSDRYANHNTVYYDVNMKGHDGQQGPMYVGTGCVFRRQALYGFEPPINRKSKQVRRATCCCCWPSSRDKREDSADSKSKSAPAGTQDDLDVCSQVGDDGSMLPLNFYVRRFGLCHNFIATICDTRGCSMVRFMMDMILWASWPTEFSSQFDKHALLMQPHLSPREVLSDVILVISCGYEDCTEWGKEVGWMYGSVTEDIVTGYVMHTKGWLSVYCMPARPAFKGSAPINLTDRLAQVLRWATGSIEICFSQHNALWCDWCSRLQLTQRIAYLNTSVYPFTSLALVVYCFLPAIGLFANQFIVKSIDNWTVLYFLALFLAIFATAILEIRWSGVSLEEWWRNEQFWVIGGTSAHLAAVLQGLLKVFAGVDIHFTLTSKGADAEDEFAELYVIRWTWLFLVPLTIILVNCFAILAGIAQTINKASPNWGELLGKLFFSVWVLLHLYPFAKGLMGRSQRLPTIVLVWSMLLSIILSLLWARLTQEADCTCILEAMCMHSRQEECTADMSKSALKASEGPTVFHLIIASHSACHDSQSKLPSKRELVVLQRSKLVLLVWPVVGTAAKRVNGHASSLKLFQGLEAEVVGVAVADERRGNARPGALLLEGPHDVILLPREVPDGDVGVQVHGHDHHIAALLGHHGVVDGVVPPRLHGAQHRQLGARRGVGIAGRLNRSVGRVPAVGANEAAGDGAAGPILGAVVLHGDGLGVPVAGVGHAVGVLEPGVAGEARRGGGQPGGP
eukprot:SM000214S06773  [mRNA]  locus=s214:32662:42297:- [translate_table: standard]